MDTDETPIIRYEKEVANQHCNIHFFKGWSGYAHPVAPRGPCDYKEVLSQMKFVEVAFSQDKQPVIVQVATYAWKFDSLSTDWLSDPIYMDETRVFEAVVDKKGTPTEIGRPLSLKEASTLERFVRAVRTKAGLHVDMMEKQSTLVFTYHYAGDLLKKVVIKNEEGEKELLY